jgi:hypothetical protein
MSKSAGLAQRPAITVVLTFHGSEAEAEVALAELGRLRLGPGDAALLVDNTEGEVARRCKLPSGVAAAVSPIKKSVYAARNVGAETAITEWLQELLQRHPYRPMAVTANLLVRRAAWESVGGFAERTRSGADADFCWRLMDAGWTLEYRDAPAVTHDHRRTVRALLAQSRRDGAGGTWLARRWPGYRPFLGPRGFLRALAGALGWPLLGQPRRGLFKALDGIWGAAFDIGGLGSNAPPEPAAPEVIALLDEVPAAEDPLPVELADALAAGRAVAVEARRRPVCPGWAAVRELPVHFWEDDGPLSRLAAVIRLLTTGPQRLPAELGPPARRLGGAAAGATLIAQPELIDTAHLLARAARRPDLQVETIAGPVFAQR